MRELLVEIAAQPVELLRLAQILRRDRFVEFRYIGVIFGTARFVLSVLARTPRLVRGFRVAHVGIVRHVGGGRIHRLARSVRQFLGGDFHLLHAHALSVLGVLRVAVLALILLIVALARLVLVLLGIARA